MDKTFDYVETFGPMTGDTASTSSGIDLSYFDNAIGSPEEMSFTDTMESGEAGAFDQSNSGGDNWFQIGEIANKNDIDEKYQKKLNNKQSRELLDSLAERTMISPVNPETQVFDASTFAKNFTKAMEDGQFDDWTKEDWYEFGKMASAYKESASNNPVGIGIEALALGAGKGGFGPAAKKIREERKAFGERTAALNDLGAKMVARAEMLDRNNVSTMKELNEKAEKAGPEEPKDVDRLSSTPFSDAKAGAGATAGAAAGATTAPEVTSTTSTPADAAGEKLAAGEDAKSDTGKADGETDYGSGKLGRVWLEDLLSGKEADTLKDWLSNNAKRADAIMTGFDKVANGDFLGGMKQIAKAANGATGVLVMVNIMRNLWLKMGHKPSGAKWDEFLYDIGVNPNKAGVGSRESYFSTGSGNSSAAAGTEGKGDSFNKGLTSTVTSDEMCKYFRVLAKQPNVRKIYITKM